MLQDADREEVVPQVCRFMRGATLLSEEDEARRPIREARAAEQGHGVVLDDEDRRQIREALAAEQGYGVVLDDEDRRQIREALAVEQGQ